MLKFFNVKYWCFSWFRIKKYQFLSDLKPLQNKPNCIHPLLLKGNGEITFGKNVFTGSNVTILKGVTVGDNSVIGNGSVVTKSIPENVVVAGNPAKIIRKL